MEVKHIMSENVVTKNDGLSKKMRVAIIVQTVLVAAALILSCFACFRSHEPRRIIIYAGQAVVCLLIVIFGCIKYKDRDRKYLALILNCYAVLEILRAVLIITTGISPVISGITRLILSANACCLILLSERIRKKDSQVISILVVAFEVALYLVFLLGFPGVMYGRINRFIPLAGVFIAGSIALFTRVKNEQLGIENDSDSLFPRWGAVIGIVLSAVLVVISFGTTTMKGSADKSVDYEVLSSWTDTAPLKSELTAYMTDITDPGSPDFIPVENRVAVFDMDGTLIAETNPYYFDHCLLIYRVLEDPAYKDKASDFEKETAYAILKGIQTGEFPDDMMNMHGQAVAKAFAGMTIDEFMDYVMKFRDEAAPGYDGMTRGQSFYLPMLEVIDFLQENDFTVYVVSGTDRIITRGIIKDNIDIPMSQVIGSDETIVSSSQGESDGLNFQMEPSDRIVTGGDFVVKNLKMNKVSVIAQEIGVQPVLSFGNSTGDSSMCDYTVNNNPYKSMAFMLCCDDLEREYGNQSKADKMYGLCKEHGWTAVSMKNDWTTIYGEGVTKNPDAGLDYYYDYVIPD